MNLVNWIQERPIETLGAPVSYELARAPHALSRNVGVGAGVSVATSGFVPAILVLGVLGLAFYGFGKVMQRQGYDQ